MEPKFKNLHQTLHLTLTFTYADGAFTVIGENPFASPNSAPLENLWRLPYSTWANIDTLSVSAHVVNPPEGFQWQLLIAKDELYKVTGPDMDFELGFPEDRKAGMEFDIRAVAPSAERYVRLDLDNTEAPARRPRPIIITPPLPPDTTPPTGTHENIIAWRPIPDHHQLVDLLLDDYLVERVMTLRRASQPGASLPPLERARLVRELYVHMNTPPAARRAGPGRP